jgi:hypothetical protein
MDLASGNLNPSEGKHFSRITPKGPARFRDKRNLVQTKALSVYVHSLGGGLLPNHPTYTRSQKECAPMETGRNGNGIGRRGPQSHLYYSGSPFDSGPWPCLYPGPGPVHTRNPSQENGQKTHQVEVDRAESQSARPVMQSPVVPSHQDEREDSWRQMSGQKQESQALPVISFFKRATDRF